MKRIQISLTLEDLNILHTAMRELYHVDQSDKNYTLARQLTELLCELTEGAK